MVGQVEIILPAFPVATSDKYPLQVIILVNDITHIVGLLGHCQRTLIDTRTYYRCCGIVRIPFMYNPQLRTSSRIGIFITGFTHRALDIYLLW
jgi:hypothetical protein